MISSKNGLLWRAIAKRQYLASALIEGADVDGLLNDLGCVLAFCEELTDLSAGVNTDGPRRSWTEADMRRIARMARKLLTFAAGKVRPFAGGYMLCNEY